jgi:lysophospholipase L1-like esterase
MARATSAVTGDSPRKFRRFSLPPAAKYKPDEELVASGDMTDRRILCFGDSLTWGWVSTTEGAPTERFSRTERWTGVLADDLGQEYTVIEEGLSARTTNVDDPSDPRLNGAGYLPSCLASHLPLDLVIVMLGTNDTKAYFGRTPLDVGIGMSLLIGQVLTSTGGVGTEYPSPDVLVVAPPPLADMPHPWFRMIFEGAREKTVKLAEVYEALASFTHVNFFDAGAVITTDGSDGIHFSEENNRDLGRALAAKVREIV